MTNLSFSSDPDDQPSDVRTSDGTGQVEINVPDTPSSPSGDSGGNTTSPSGD